MNLEGRASACVVNTACRSLNFFREKEKLTSGTRAPPASVFPGHQKYLHLSAFAKGIFDAVVNLSDCVVHAVVKRSYLLVFLTPW